MVTFSERLKAERVRLGANQDDFAEAAGIARGTQVNYENGSRNPDAQYLERVAAFGVDVLFLLTGRRTPAGNDVMSESEAELFDHYRSLDEADQAVARRVVGALAGGSVSSPGAGGVSVGGKLVGQAAGGDINNQAGVSIGNKKKK